jgi:CSLREA domain-containing protein
MKNRVFNLFTLFALLLSLVGSFASVTPAYAAGIVVNTAADENDTGSDCSLREAITAANTDSAYGGCPAGAGSDAITFAGNYTITLSSQLPLVTTTITITGNGAANTIVQADAVANTATYRVFEINLTGSLALNNLTVRHGRCNGFCENATTDGSGIYNLGTLAVTNSIIANNSGTGGGGGIINYGTLTVTNSTLSNNSALSGGGISNAGTLTVTNSTISGNSATNGGGGIINVGTLTVANSTISDNSSPGSGGGVSNIDGTVTVTNSTFSGNSTANNGGGLYNDNSSPTLTNVTFSGNSANANGGGMLNNGGGSSPTLKNVILANSISGGDCVNTGGASLNGSSSNNLIESTEGGACGLTDGVGGNIIGSADPALGSLADNGGPTQTHALGTSSPALSTGTNTGCPSTDQRGVARPQLLVCDIGAVESNTQQNSTLVVNTADDSNDGFCDAFVAGITDCTLREAITYANGVAGTWSITFASNYTITLGSQLPAVTGTIIINGNGAANTIIQANAAPNTANYRVFLVNPGSLTLNQVTVRHGVSSGVGGGIYVLSGTLAINNSLISANDSFDGGGGVYNSLSDVTITNSTFADNTSSNAGAALTNQGTMTISNSTISNNAATGTNNYAGGIRNLSTLNIYNSTISGNTSTSAVFDGSNIAQDGGTLNLRNTIIANSTDGDCVITGGTLGINANNLIEDASSACGLTNGSNGNIIGSDPALGSLTGSPAYFPLNTGSPAIDAGDTAICDAAPVNNQAQNEVTRPEGSACDIGSFEFDYSPTISSITRVSTSPTSATSVGFTVTFSEAVQNVGVSDFTLTKSSGISGESVASVSGSGAVYTVTVNTGSGSGTLRLDVPVSASIQDLSNNTLEGLPFTSGETYTKVVSATYKSAPTNDGWILESSETSNTGGAMNSTATTFNLGDDATDKQYRAILHFDTSALPDTAVVTTMTLKIKQQGAVTGISPFTFASLYVDMRNPAFGGSALELADFNFAAKKVKSAVFNPNAVSGWFSASFNNGGKLYVNRTGVSQLRLYFSVDDNNNNIADFIKFASGNAPAGDRPKLLITYYVP